MEYSTHYQSFGDEWLTSIPRVGKSPRRLAGRRCELGVVAVTQKQRPTLRSQRGNGVKMGGMRYPPDRRSFLIAGGLTALASTRVLGANDTLRIGVLGAGGRMNDLLNAAEKAGAYQIVAVSDVYGPRRDAIKERSKGMAATSHVNYREVLDQQLDAVFIASPD